MAVIISFRNGARWHRRTWIYRQLVKDVIAQSPDDKELSLIMEQGDAYSHLALDTLEPAAASKTLRAIRKVAEDTLQGKIPGYKATKPKDITNQHIYLEVIAELLDLIKQDADL